MGLAFQRIPLQDVTLSRSHPSPHNLSNFVHLCRYTKPNSSFEQGPRKREERRDLPLPVWVGNGDLAVGVIIVPCRKKMETSGLAEIRELNFLLGLKLPSTEDARDH